MNKFNIAVLCKLGYLNCSWNEDKTDIIVSSTGKFDNEGRNFKQVVKEYNEYVRKGRKQND